MIIKRGMESIPPKIVTQKIKISLGDQKLFIESPSYLEHKCFSIFSNTTKI